MRHLPRVALWAVLIGVAPVVGGCSSFDPDSLDIFGLNEKKKLPGERRDVFPEGVPGVSQGIPTEYLRQPNAGAAPMENTAPQPAALPAEPAPVQAKPRPQPRRAAPARAPAPAAAAAPVAPVEAQPMQPAQQQAPAPSAWPAPQPSGSSAWPAPPPSGTFQR